MGSPWLLGGPLAPSQSSLRVWGEGQGRYRLGGQSRAVLHGPPPHPSPGPSLQGPGRVFLSPPVAPGSVEPPSLVGVPGLRLPSITHWVGAWVVALPGARQAAGGEGASAWCLSQAWC